MKRNYALVSLAIVFVLASPAYGAAVEDLSLNVLSDAEASMLQPRVASATSAVVSGSITAPGWVQPYQVQCSRKGQLRVEICDCCIPGDHFEASVRIWDKMPTVVKALSTGSTSAYRGVWATSYGAQPLEALVNVRYKHGINVFGAGYSVKFTCYPSSSVLTWSALTQVPDTSQ